MSQDEIFGHRFPAFQSPARGRDADPMTDLLQQLAEGRLLSPDELHVDDLFEGLMEPAEVRQTVKQWLEDINRDQKNHIEVGSAPCCQRKMLPKPFAQAFRVLAISQGWAWEAVCQAVFAMQAFLEHPETRLKEFAEEIHDRGPSIPAFAGLAASDRKSSLVKWVSGMMIDVPELPDDVRSGTTVCNDGTLRGLREALSNYSRGGLISDEVSNTYCTSFSEAKEKSGIHYVNRSKMCTYCSQERDSSQAGLVRGAML